MNFNFNKEITEFLKIIAKNAQNDNIRVFFVGGIVRDNVLKLPNDDIDLIVEGNAIEFAKRLPQEIQVKSVHIDFGTVKVAYCGCEIDIASTRCEKYPHSGCLPVVTKIGVPVEQDVKRRDFTVNSIYCEIILVDNNLKYVPIDLVSGFDDIKNKTLQVLHKKSYIDDPTRILRGLNFKYRFNFDFSNQDKKLIDEYLDNVSYENMSYDRIFSVFKHVLSSKFNTLIFDDIIKNNYYKILSNQNLLIDINEIQKIIDLFSLDVLSRRDFYLKIILNENTQAQNFQTKSEIVKFFNKMEISDIAYYYFKTSDKNVFIYQEIRDISLFVNGNILKEYGYLQGKIIGDILNALLEQKYQTPSLFASLDDEITWVLKSYPKN